MKADSKRELPKEKESLHIKAETSMKGSFPEECRMGKAYINTDQETGPEMSMKEIIPKENRTEKAYTHGQTAVSTKEISKMTQ